MTEFVVASERGQAWYRQFWPWFLIALPAAAVLASVATLVIALDNADSLVREDWYESGQRINEELAQDAAAVRARISALLSVGGEGAVAVQLDIPGGQHPEQLELELHHPTDAARDLRLSLHRDGAGLYAGTLPLPPRTAGATTAATGGRTAVAGTWDALLQPTPGGWRLEARVVLPAERIRLGAGS